MEGDDITFNKMTNRKKSDPEHIVSNANYESEIYDTTTDFKSLGVIYYNIRFVMNYVKH
jgi:hypothetical protein